jgi:predicted nucleic acid-binding protein
LATDLRVFDLTPVVLDSAMALAEKHALRGYDAVQLAVAQAIHNERIRLNLSSLTLVASDNDLNKAAGGEGLVTDDPNLH